MIVHVIGKVGSIFVELWYLVGHLTSDAHDNWVILICHWRLGAAPAPMLMASTAADTPDPPTSM